MAYLNVYLIDKAFGGPEEGGWWYTYGDPVESIHIDDDDDDDDFGTVLADRLRAKYDKLNSERRCDISSMASEGKYVVKEEEGFARSFPQTQPRFE